MKQTVTYKSNIHESSRKQSSGSIRGPDAEQMAGNWYRSFQAERVDLQCQRAIFLVCDDLEWVLTLLLDALVFVIVVAGSRHGGASTTQNQPTLICWKLSSALTRSTPVKTIYRARRIHWDTFGIASAHSEAEQKTPPCFHPAAQLTFFLDREKNRG